MCEVEGIEITGILQRKKKLTKMNKKGSQFWPNFVQVVSFKYEEQRK